MTGSFRTFTLATETLVSSEPQATSEVLQREALPMTRMPCANPFTSDSTTEESFWVAAVSSESGL